MVETRRIHVVLLAAAITAITAIAAIAPAGHAQNATDWLANTYGTLAAHVGNTARSMWVAPEGVIYTASMWDEYEGGVAIYQNGKSVGSIGSHAEFQGGAITGNAASVFVALQYDKSHGSGAVGRYNRVTKARELSIQVSASTDQPRVDVVTGLATVGSLLYASDFYGNRVRLFTTDGVWQRDIGVAGPGALAVDRAGNVWVARKRAGEIVEFSAAGALLNTLRMPGGSQPSALYFDAPSGQLMVGDEGPDMNIKRYAVTGAPALVGTFGIQGGYLDTTTGIKGQVGARRFTRVAGIGKDAAGNLYVLNNPWGGSWDLGRNGATDIHAYDSAGNLQWTLQSLNFEGIAAADPATDGALFYGGTHIYAGSAGGTFVANTVDPFSYPSDPRIDMNDTQRDDISGNSSPSARTGFSWRRARIRRSSTFSISTRRMATSRFRTRRCRARRSIRPSGSRAASASTARAACGPASRRPARSTTTRWPASTRAASRHGAPACRPAFRRAFNR